MTIKKLDWFQSIAREAIKDDDDRDKNIAKCRDIVALKWELPEALADLDWMRTFKVSAPKDGMSAAIRTFSNLMPTLNIHPNNTSKPEARRVEDLEDTLMWHFRKANHRGVRSPLEMIVESVVETGIVAAQVKYIPYDYKGRSDARTKALKKGGDFAYVIHKPETIHVRHTQELLESVLKACLMTVTELEKEIGADNPAMAKIIEEIMPDKKKDLQATKDTTMVAFYDYMDYDHRVKWAQVTDEIDDSESGDGDSYEIMREPHKLKFLPWVFRQSREPLLQSVIDSDSWENQNILKSMQYALLAATVAQARTVAKTNSGEPIEIDYTRPDAQAVMRPNEDLQQFPPPQTDPNLERQIMQGEQNITQQMNTRALQAATDIASSAPFATFNAIMQTAVASLSDQTKTAERALEDIFEHQLCWIDYSGIPLVGSRYKKREGYEFDSSLAKGAQLSIGPGTDNEFDPYDIEIDVKLRPDSPSDRQTRLIQAIQLVDKLHFSVDDALEAYGLDDLDRNEESWMNEQLTNAVFQAKVQQIMANAQLQVQMAAQQQQAQALKQQQMSQQNQSAEMAQGGMFTNPGSVPTSMGGAGAQQNYPSGTREGLTGQTQQGEAIV